MDRQLVDVALSWPLLRHMLGGIFDDAAIVAGPVCRKATRFELHVLLEAEPM